MALEFDFNLPDGPWAQVPMDQWSDWAWQMRQSLKTATDFQKWFTLSNAELEGFTLGTQSFQIRTTPYYAQLADPRDPNDPIRRMLMPHSAELQTGQYAVPDPLGERKNAANGRLIHRFSDRVLWLVTDVCGVYCRYCTRKHFTGHNEAFMPLSDYESSLQYLQTHPGIREVILSGGDPLTLSDRQLEKILTDLRQISHIEIIRVGSRMPVVNPFRITPELAKILRSAAPLFFMTHFNHPRELTDAAATALNRLVDSGIPVLNQMVLLNGVNNSAALIQALSRRLLFLRVKPYYMFQCDPSEGTDHLRIPLSESLRLQRELWGHISGLAMPALSLDIPGGGGKVSYVPDFESAEPQMVGSKETRFFRGWDGVVGTYESPASEHTIQPVVEDQYQKEWEQLQLAKSQVLSPAATGVRNFSTPARVEQTSQQTF